MRSLSLAKTQSWDFPEGKLTLTTYDAEQDCIYALSDSGDEDSSQSQIGIYRLKRVVPGEGTPRPYKTFAIPTLPMNDRTAVSSVVSLRFLGETQSLAIVTRAGDIGLISLDDETLDTFEVVGSIDAGITAATWSPDESFLVVATGDDKLLLMTNTFDVLLEQHIHAASEGEAQQVNVGWGSKQTQFHGSLGKAAANATPQSLDTIGSSPDDDGCVRIAWRGDGAYFAVSSLEEPLQSEGKKHRALRVYDRQGALQNTAEPIAGLEHVLSWRPSGNLIVSTQRFGFEGGGVGRTGRHDVVFFERNGLRHGEFALREVSKEGADASRRWGYKVKEALWNADSSILALWIEDEEMDKVQLWTTGNYHWYLKQELRAFSSDLDSRRFTCVMWHPEHAQTLLLVSSVSVKEHVFAWEIYASRLHAPNDTGCVAVVDGANLLLTPFRTQNVPPPMASYDLSLGESAGVPIHVAFSRPKDCLAVLTQEKKIKVWELKTCIGSGKGKILDPSEQCVIDLSKELNSSDFRQICFWEKNSSPEVLRFACLAKLGNTDFLVNVEVAHTSEPEIEALLLPEGRGRLVESSSGIYWQSPAGNIHSFSDPLSDSPSQICRFPELCFHTEVACQTDEATLFVGHSETNRLYCALSGSENVHTLAPNCASFVIAADFVIFTTSTHEAFFLPLKSLRKLLLDNSNAPQWEQRRVERGARIVTAVPSNMALVLQMPRGNLETIYPRPLVLAVVKQDIEAGDYRKAFLECRKHRLDLSILVEHNSEKFLNSISSFVEQLNDVDYLNLFLTNLGQTLQDPEKLSTYCNAIRQELESRDLTKYINSVLTALVVKKPPDHETALLLLHRLRESDSDLVEEAVKYVIFLVDADKLFNIALGMYDFSLVLLIAQHSQRDPREYLPFLRELRALPKYYQRFKIDDHLKKSAGALNNLHQAGVEYFDQALGYIEKHQLYSQALNLWKGEQESYERVLNAYGEFLFERREFQQAAHVFVEARKYARAIVAYERALLWKELFVLTIQESMTHENMKALGQRVGDELLAKKRFEEASRVFQDHGQDLRQSINALVQGSFFSEARRLIALHGLPSLLTDIVYPAALDARHQISEDLDEMRAQLLKQVDRIRELRVKKAEEPDAFYGLEDDPALHLVDVMTDISMAPTAFTRYTAAPTTTSRASKRTSRSKRKMERKVGSGRKGTIDEEEYLLKSIGKLVTRFDSMQDDIAQLLQHLMQFTEEHREEARDLQNEMKAFREQLQEVLSEVWPTKSGDDDEGAPSLSWAERMEEKKRERKTAVDSITKPALQKCEAEWKVEFL